MGKFGQIRTIFIRHGNKRHTKSPFALFVAVGIVIIGSRFNAGYCNDGQSNRLIRSKRQIEAANQADCLCFGIRADTRSQR